MKYVIVVIFIGFGFISKAQLILKPIEEQHLNGRISRTSAFDTTLLLPFWDDFSLSGDVPDSTKWWIGNDVYVNSTLGFRPPTYKVATFDGLNANGIAYNLESDFAGQTDSLITQRIDLSTVPAANRNTMYLSFFWQAEGNGELPDERDSLSIQFLRNDSVWVSQALGVGRPVITGGPEAKIDSSLLFHFHQEIIPVSGDPYFHENFRIKFQAFGNQGGPFDTWHIDYVYLNEGRSLADTFYLDRGISTPPTALFAPYYEIPAAQFYGDTEKFLSNQEIYVHNLFSGPQGINCYSIISNETHNLRYDSVFVDFSIVGEPFHESYSVEKVIFDYQDLGINNGIVADSIIISNLIYYHTDDDPQEFGDVRINDTIRTYYTLHQHYAYDDGSAEYAAGINMNRGQLAVRFVMETPDTLTHIDVCFPSASPSSAGKSVDLQVWRKLENRGLVTIQPFTIQQTGRNEFARVKLSEPAIMSDTFYIGYRQFVDHYIGLGFDRSNPLASDHIFFNPGDAWEENISITGALMIRPVFGTDTAFVIDGIKPSMKPLVMYPNPTSGAFTIKERHDQLRVFDLSGQLMYQASKEQEEYDLSHLQPGLYIVRVQRGEDLWVRKLVIR